MRASSWALLSFLFVASRLCADLADLAPGEALVLKPSGQGPGLMQRLLPGQWAGLP